MKKILIVIIGLLAFIPFVGKANVDVTKYKYTDLYDTIKAEGGKTVGKYPTTDDGVNVFLLWGKGCPHCADFIEFIGEYYKEFNHINLYAFEVWYEEDNQKLLTAVGKEFNTDIRGVPYIVIGDKTFSGFGVSKESEIKEAIQNEYKKSVDKRSKRLYVTTKGTKTTTNTIGATKEYPETNTTTSTTGVLNANNPGGGDHGGGAGNTTTTTETNNTGKYGSSNDENKNKNGNDATKYIMYGLTAVVGLAFIIFIIKGIKR